MIKNHMTEYVNSRFFYSQPEQTQDLESRTGFFNILRQIIGKTVAFICLETLLIVLVLVSTGYVLNFF